MYMKDLNHKMTLRLNDELKAFVDEMSEKYMISPSDFIRQCISQNLDARRMTQRLVDSIGEKALTEVLENGIDRKTDDNNQL